MIRFVQGFAVVAAQITLLCVCGCESAPNIPHQTASNIEHVKLQVQNLETQRLAAISDADFDALAALLADDYQHVLGNGTSQNKAEYIASVKQIPRVPARGPLTIRIYGDVAVLTGDFVNRMQVAGQPERILNAYVTQIARRIDGRWKFEFFQVSQKQPPRPATPAS